MSAVRLLFAYHGDVTELELELPREFTPLRLVIGDSTDLRHLPELYICWWDDALFVYGDDVRVAGDASARRGPERVKIEPRRWYMQGVIAFVWIDEPRGELARPLPEHVPTESPPRYPVRFGNLRSILHRGPDKEVFERFMREVRFDERALEYARSIFATWPADVCALEITDDVLADTRAPLALAQTLLATITRRWSAEGWGAFHSHELSPRRVELSVSPDAMGAVDLLEASELLLAAPWLGEIRQLGCRRVFFHQSRFEVLLRELGPLQELRLEDCGIDAEAVTSLAAWPHLRELAALELSTRFDVARSSYGEGSVSTGADCRDYYPTRGAPMASDVCVVGGFGAAALDVLVRGLGPDAALEELDLRWSLPDAARAWSIAEHQLPARLKSVLLDCPMCSDDAVWLRVVDRLKDRVERLEFAGAEVSLAMSTWLAQLDWSRSTLATLGISAPAGGWLGPDLRWLRQAAEAGLRRLVLHCDSVSRVEELGALLGQFEGIPLAEIALRFPVVGSWAGEPAPGLFVFDMMESLAREQARDDRAVVESIRHVAERIPEIEKVELFSAMGCRLSWEAINDHCADFGVVVEATRRVCIRGCSACVDLS